MAEREPDSPPESAAQRAESPWWRRAPVLVAAGLLALLGLLYALDLLVTGGKVPRDVVIAGVHVGGLDRDAATALLREAIEPRLAAPARVAVDGASATIAPQAGEVVVDYASTLEHAMRRPLHPMRRLAAYFTNRQVDPVAVGKQEQIKEELAALAAEVDVEEVEGTIEFTDGSPRAVEPVAGRRLDRDRAAEQIVAQWPRGDEIELAVAERPVTASADGVRRALEEIAAPAVAGPVTMRAEGEEAEFGPEDIGTVLEFVPAEDGSLTAEVSSAALREVLRTELRSTESRSKNATIKFGKKRATVRPSVDGRSVDWDDTADAVLDALLATGSNRIADVAYQETPAKVTTEDLEELGITEVIGEFTTGGFAPDSGVNIRTVAEKVNGAVVRPGETFSLNKFTGPRGSAQGYVAAAVIENGELSRAVGGGISQFATTLYNAAYFAAMEDVEHSEHSFYISRYPLAREATVYQNPDGSSVIDLKFRNNNPTGVAIQTVWTPSDITVRIWGTKYYEVESITGERFAWTGIPVVTKPWGTPCTPRGGAAGFSATDTRVITDLEGNDVEREKRTVVYRPQQAVRCAPPPPKPKPEKPEEHAAPADDGDDDAEDGDGE